MNSNNKFDPSNISIPNGNYFALPYTVEQSDLVLLSVPWDVTTSYGGGASQAPDAIIDASEQIDLYDYHSENIYTRGIGTLPIDEDILELSCSLRKEATKVINLLSEGVSEGCETITKRSLKVNNGSKELNEYVYSLSKQWLLKGKTVGLVGGDHSTPLGLFKAVSESFEDVGILHIDAHADLRESFETFTYSHASIMYNMLNEIPAIKKLVQVGVRDFCEEEREIVLENDKVTCFYDAEISERLFEGDTWKAICDDIISHLPKDVHISLDIDGLGAEFCPSTGTPVPGGLSFNGVVYLIARLTQMGHRIVGFDLTEVVPCDDNEWDANVGARMLYKLCCQTLSSNLG